MADCEVQVSTNEESENNNGSSEPERTSTENDAQMQRTKIPGPVRSVASGSCLPVSNRRYQSLVPYNPLCAKPLGDSSSHSGNEMSFEDSGVQLDCSNLSEEPVRASSSMPLLKADVDAGKAGGGKQPTVSSQMDIDEQQTLRELQRAVAEMEADVELHAEALVEQIEMEQYEMQPELSNAPALPAEEEVVAAESMMNFMQSHMSLGRLEQQIRQEMEEQSEEETESSVQESDDSSGIYLPAELSVSDMQQNVSLAAASTNPAAHFVGNSNARERKLVRLDQLLEAHNNIELLHNLLQSSSHNRREAEVAHSVSTPIPLGLTSAERPSQLGNELAELPKKNVGMFRAILQMLCTGGMRKLGYPILLCGMAVGLIYYYKKV